MATLVIDLMDRRPIRALPASSRRAILAAVPAGWTVRFVVVGAKGVDRVVGEADYLVLAVAETPETSGLMNRRRFASMKPGSVLINVARGRLVDEEALLAVLDSSHLRGAGLDVFH